MDKPSLSNQACDSWTNCKVVSGQSFGSFGSHYHFLQALGGLLNKKKSAILSSEESTDIFKKSCRIWLYKNEIW